MLEEKWRLIRSPWMIQYASFRSWCCSSILFPPNFLAYHTKTTSSADFSLQHLPPNLPFYLSFRLFLISPLRIYLQIQFLKSQLCLCLVTALVLVDDQHHVCLSSHQAPFTNGDQGREEKACQRRSFSERLWSHVNVTKPRDSNSLGRSG